MQFQDAPDKILRVNVKDRRVEQASEVPESNYYLVTSPSWQIARVVDATLTWEDFSLTFRVYLKREPDVYQTLIQGSLIPNPEDWVSWAKLMTIEANTERITVEAGGKRYSMNRFCPHQGAELCEGWIEEDRYLVCSRHRWRFDLHNDGLCETSGQSIGAFAVEEDCIVRDCQKNSGRCLIT